MKDASRTRMSVMNGMLAFVFNSGDSRFEERFEKTCGRPLLLVANGYNSK